MGIVPEAQRVGDHNPVFAALLLQADAGEFRLQGGDPPFERRGDLRLGYDVELRSVTFGRLLAPFESSAAAAVHGIVGVVAGLRLHQRSIVRNTLLQQQLGRAHRRLAVRAETLDSAADAETVDWSTLTDEKMKLLDRVAELTLAGDEAFPQLRKIYESDERLRVPPVVFNVDRNASESVAT